MGLNTRRYVFPRFLHDAVDPKLNRGELFVAAIWVTRPQRDRLLPLMRHTAWAAR
jgi:hypothetical protein